MGTMQRSDRNLYTVFLFCTVGISPFLDSKDPRTLPSTGREKSLDLQAAFSSSQYCSGLTLNSQAFIDYIPSSFRSDITSAYRQRMENGLLLLNLSSLVTSHQTVQMLIYRLYGTSVFYCSCSSFKTILSHHGLWLRTFVTHLSSAVQNSFQVLFLLLNLAFGIHSLVQSSFDLVALSQRGCIYRGRPRFPLLNPPFGQLLSLRNISSPPKLTWEE